MKKQNLAISIAIIVVAAAAGVYLMHQHVEAPKRASSTEVSSGGDRVFALACAKNKSLDLTFHLPEDKSIDVVLSDGRQLSLVNTSGSEGASYTSLDGKTVLSLDGTTLKIADDGVMTYTDCTLADSGAAAQAN